MKRSLSFLLLSLAAFCPSARAQNLEFSGGYAHITGDQGLDGFNVGAAVWFTHRFSIAADYDGVFDNSRIGIFELTQTGVIASKSHLQDLLFGPRFFFPGLIKTGNKHVARLLPFGEAEFGVSDLKSSIRQTASNFSQSASDTAFSWMLGGGTDYRINPHWAGRLKLDLLRTHIAEAGQSRFRLSLGVVLTLGERE
jgi:Outer membrane protein beta-barrel domain